MTEVEAAAYLDEWVFRDRETLDAMARSGEMGSRNPAVIASE